MPILSDSTKAEVENAKKRLLNILNRNEDASDSLDFEFYTPLEGHPDWSKIDEMATSLVDEASWVIEFDSDTTEEKMREARRVGDALTTVAGSMTKNRKRLRKGDHTLLPPYFIWTMHNTCNFRCTYCDNHSGEKYFDLKNDGKLDTEQGKKLLDIVRNDVTGIYFCGGEPTLRKDLPELAEYANSINYFPLMINTNGSRIHKMITDERYSRWLKNMDIIIVSLDALNIDSLAKVWGVKESLCEQVIANILALRRLQKKVRFKLMVNTVITPDTIKEADAILDWANDLGIWYSPVPMNCGTTVNSELTKMPDYQNLCDKIIERKKQGYKILGSKKLVEGLLSTRKIDCHPSLKPHVDIDGSLIWPCKTKSNLKPVKINILDHETFDDAYQAGAKIISPNNIHGHGPDQCGADCSWMQNYVSDIYARGLEKPLRSGILMEMLEFAGVA